MCIAKTVISLYIHLTALNAELIWIYVTVTVTKIYCPEGRSESYSRKLLKN